MWKSWRKGHLRLREQCKGPEVGQSLMLLKNGRGLWMEQGQFLPPQGLCIGSFFRKHTFPPCPHPHLQPSPFCQHALLLILHLPAQSHFLTDPCDFPVEVKISYYPYTHFLGLLYQTSTNEVASNNRNPPSHSSRGQKSQIRVSAER